MNEEILENHRFALGIQPKMKNWTTWYLPSSVILLGLSNVPQNLSVIYQHILYQQSKSGFCVSVTLGLLKAET